MSSSSSSDDRVSVTLQPELVKEITLKLLVIGDYGVGKTAIVRQYAEGRFSTNYKITIGADFSVKTIPWDCNTQLNVQLWDIGGHERFGAMTRVYYKYAAAAAVVFDVSRISTFHSVQKWLNDLREKVSLFDGSHIPVVIMANKCDIVDVEVPSDALHKLCRDWNVPRWYPTSAKFNHNIDDAITFLVSCAMENSRREISQAADSILLHSSESRGGESKGCCA